jgi:hypothetical protein
VTTPTPSDLTVRAYDLFLAYAGADLPTARALVNELHGRVSVFWDHFIPPDESFQSAIPRALRSSLVFAVLVSTNTWKDQHYTSDEVALAVELARERKMRVVPIWLDDFRVGDKPYGLITLTGIRRTVHQGCVGCIAGHLVEVVLRARLADLQRRAISR